VVKDHFEKKCTNFAKKLTLLLRISQMTRTVEFREGKKIARKSKIKQEAVQKWQLKRKQRKQLKKQRKKPVRKKLPAKRNN